MATGSGLDLICDEVSRLEGIRHSTRAHADAVTDSNGAKLIPNHTSVDYGPFYTLTKTEQVTVTSGRVLGGTRGQTFVWRSGAYGFPSYLFDRHGVKKRIEPEDERTDQTLATPIIAFWKSSSELTPSVAYSMAYTRVKADEREKRS